MDGQVLEVALQDKVENPMTRQSNETASYSRRSALALGLGGSSLVAISFPGCDVLSTHPASGNTSTPSNRNAIEGQESPNLVDAVKQGDLPRLEKRIPSEPMVLQPLDEPGHYGGDLNLVMRRGEDIVVDHSISYEQLLRWKPGATQLTADNAIPNVAASFEANSNATEYTFHLRKGMKWSDGYPFTADDIVFWYEDVLDNEELTPVWPQWLTTEGKNALIVEKLDDHTVMFRFSQPNGLFLSNATSRIGGDLTRFPKHYLHQFHKRYSDDINKKVKDAGLDNWTALFFNKSDFHANPHMPVLHAWLLSSGVEASAQRVVANRNPYYWKTDQDGKQLPYIDKVVYNVVDSDETAVLKVARGDIDWLFRGVNQLSNKPVFARNRNKSNYHFFDTIPQQMNRMIITLNMTAQDRTLRNIFSAKEFRIGLSHAIDRKSVIDAVYARQGKPWQAAPRPESGYSNERLAKQYTEFDREVANKYLDKVVPEKDSDGIRLRPDGKRLVFQVDTASQWPDMVPALEMIKKQWRAVGIDIGIKNEDGGLYSERTLANKHDASVWLGDGGIGVALGPWPYFPFNVHSRYAKPWVYWWRDPENELAEEPPAETRRQIELYQKLKATANKKERHELMAKILQIAAEQFYCIGIALRKRDYGVVSNNLVNTPKLAVTGFHHADLMPSNPQQYFFSE